MTGRFTLAEGETYGRCAACGLKVVDRAAAREHGRETMILLNPPREDLVDRAVSSVVDDAVVEAVNHLLGMLGDDGLSEDEVTSSLFFYPDFLDEWQKALFDKKALFDEDQDDEEGDWAAETPPQHREQLQLELPLDIPEGDDHD